MNQFNTDTDDLEEEEHGGGGGDKRGDGGTEAGSVSGNDQAGLTSEAGEAVDNDGDIAMEKTESANGMVGGTDAEADGGSSSSEAGHEEDRKEEAVFQAAVQGKCVQVGGRGEAVAADAGEPQEVDELDDDDDEGWSAAESREAKEEPVRAGALVSRR
ncbi:hypothetical protein PMKS-003063 [Pichia membranifaciens]|uniref:Uncharacterized protein n=1 Tax=Pichia membranifaciens TaxID=4926 RepID=A0A1Q2YJ37_9ASCO|nr:hypothetical protein PMKS-003063 [Pichia membranifaciens]